MNVSWRRVTGVLMAVAMTVNTACYSFVPVASGIVPTIGDVVKIRLTADGAAALTEVLGPNVEWAEGTISERRSDRTLIVGVEQIRLRDGTDRFWSGQSVVAFAPAQVAEVQRKSLDKGRTRITVIAFSVALLGIAAMALGVGGAHGAPDGGSSQPPP